MADLIPLRIQFDLLTPVVVPERPIHLDALLAWAAVDRALSFDAPAAKALAAQEHLPLEKLVTDTAWVWKASQVIFEPLAQPFLMAGTRKTNVTQIALDWDAGIVKFRSTRTTINLSGGHYRNYDYRFPVQWCSTAEGWCVGEKSIIEELLSRLNGLGKTVRNGWGRIARIAVEPCEVTECHWMRRALPLDAHVYRQPHHFEATGCLHPPYWQRTNWQNMLEYANIPEVGV